MARLLLLYILINGRLDQLILKMEVVKQKIEKKLVNYLKYRPKSSEIKLVTWIYLNSDVFYYARHQ